MQPNIKTDCEEGRLEQSQRGEENRNKEFNNPTERSRLKSKLILTCSLTHLNTTER